MAGIAEANHSGMNNLKRVKDVIIQDTKSVKYI